MTSAKYFKTHRVRSGAYVTADGLVIVTRIPKGRDIAAGWWVASRFATFAVFCLHSGPWRTLREARYSAAVCWERLTDESAE